jgi:hypothetical protein
MRARLALLIALIAQSCIYGQATASTAKVEEFFKLTQIEKALGDSMEQTMEMIKSSVVQEALGMKASPEQARQLEAFQTKVSKLLSNAFSWEKVKPDFVKLYAETYTDKEMDDILAFYRSPSGQAMVTKGMALMPKTAAISQKRLAEIQPELQKLLKEFAASTPAPRSK